MKKWFSEHKKAIILSVLGTLLPMLIGCILWNKLPENLNIHWGTDGVADGFGGKGVAVFVMPAVLAALHLLCLLITACDPGQKNQNKKALGLIFWIMPVISMVSCSVIYAGSLGREIDLTLILPFLLGIMFVAIGNYMPKMKRNFTMGIKLPWTYGNEENWNKTHRLAGKLTVAAGVVVVFTAFFPVEWMFAVILALALLICVVPAVYSYRLYKAHRAQGIQYEEIPNIKNHKRIFWVSVCFVILVLAGAAVLMFTGDITYICTEEALQIQATYDGGMALSYTAIDSVELREDFDIGSRVMGFGSARLSMGAFKNKELSAYTIYAYNACNSMILIQSGEKWLAINAQTPEETQRLYETLMQKIENQ